MKSTDVRAELLLPDDLCSFETVSELEEPLDEKLIAAGAGEVMGGGIGSGWYRFDLRLTNYDTAVALLLNWAEDLEFPSGTCLRRSGESAVVVLVSDDESSGISS